MNQAANAKELAAQVKALRKHLGRSEAARVLEIHPTSLDRASAGLPLRPNTLTLLTERLEALAAVNAEAHPAPAPAGAFKALVQLRSHAKELQKQRARSEAAHAPDSPDVLSRRIEALETMVFALLTERIEALEGATI